MAAAQRLHDLQLPAAAFRWPHRHRWFCSRQAHSRQGVAATCFLHADGRRNRPNAMLAGGSREKQNARQRLLIASVAAAAGMAALSTAAPIPQSADGAAGEARRIHRDAQPQTSHRSGGHRRMDATRAGPSLRQAKRSSLQGRRPPRGPATRPVRSLPLLVGSVPSLAPCQAPCRLGPGPLDLRLPPAHCRARPAAKRHCSTTGGVPRGCWNWGASPVPAPTPIAYTAGGAHVRVPSPRWAPPGAPGLSMTHDPDGEVGSSDRSSTKCG